MARTKPTMTGKCIIDPLKKPWSGYLVAQARFRQRPEGISSDGRQARAQLESELKKFTDAKLKLRKPEYYL
jgi:hypothetical protein